MESSHAQTSTAAPFDWGRAAQDYARHRPGPPLSFYSKLKALGIDLPGQAFADLGTNTGLIALTLA